MYRDIKSLKEYILIDSESLLAGIFRINEIGHWELEELKERKSTSLVKTIGVSLSFEDIYEGTEFLAR